jgi:predicted AAA+ superfamily ATPase
MEYKNRQISGFLEKTLSQRGIVYLNGPRQVGKSTLSACTWTPIGQTSQA